MTDELFNADDDLPPEIHLKLALDYLHSRATAIDMPVTASLIGMAARAALDELREHATPAADEGRVARGAVK
ncbi:MAG: hypothetical protein MI755_03285 [Sphingomonadales bacterium]|nr:hypothetical protein [Sphingomonadales bacterium]